MFLWMCMAESKPGQFGWNRRAIMQSTVIGRPVVCGEERKSPRKRTNLGKVYEYSCDGNRRTRSNQSLSGAIRVIQPEKAESEACW